MKYVISLLVGVVCGAALFAVGFYSNPFVGRDSLSPLVATDTNLTSLSYSRVVADSIAFSNDGESISKPHPDTIAELWEPAIVDTQLLVTGLTNSRGMPAGIGIKISSPSEATRLFNSEVLVNSVWHLYVPGRGTMVMDQTENYWTYIRDIVIPAWRSGSDSWRGNWSRNMTSGPGALGTARVTGMGGEFEDLQSEAVESLNAHAYSLSKGPVSMIATISIVLPQQSLPGEEPATE